MSSVGQIWDSFVEQTPMEKGCIAVRGSALHSLSKQTNGVQSNMCSDVTNVMTQPRVLA